MSLELLAAALAAFAASALLAVVARAHWRLARAVGFGGSAFACALLVASAALDLARGATVALSIGTSVPGLAISFRADALADVFLLILGVGGFASALYALGYVEDDREATFSVGVQAALFAAFLLSIALVLLADHALVFLVAWETMGVVSFLLVLSQRADDATREAANTYLVMMHIGSVGLLVAFVALAGAAGGSYEFAAMRAQASTATDAVKTVAFLGALVGFGTKAGLVPVHGWLPLAHPAAPSHVSALMSGVMLKAAVYMFLRVAIDFLSPGPAWWGVVVLALGGLTTFVGILFATTERDLKRVLAFSSVENLGVVFMGLGLALLFTSYGRADLATVALVAAVLHSANHMAMKGLLFLSAGSVVHATGTRDIDALGGLLKRMPWTGAFFLVGALAIAALPPLNGFVSEWLLFQSLLAGVTLPATPTLLQIVLPVGAAFFALAGAISVVCFVKAFGITFLAAPRTPAAEHAHESPRTMLAAMAVLTVVCVAIAAFAAPVVGGLATVLAPHVGGVPPPLVGPLGTLIGPGTVRASLSPALIFGVVVAFALVAYVATRLARSGITERREETWLTGSRQFRARAEYTGTAFSEATRMFFNGLYGTRREHVRRVGATLADVSGVSYRAESMPWAERYLYGPVTRFVMIVSTRARSIQAGSIHAYLAYIFVTLMIVLLLVPR
ncbi:MAG: proton-conducting transporter transmembrane domain-containing protein [Thermoplasmatota archaeon]